VGAWVGATVTLYAFCVSAIFGGIIAVAMVLLRRNWHHHLYQFWAILTEITVIRDPGALSAIAAERKGSMMLLPYGIPIAAGTIAYFVWAGMLL
jgi:prepilin peptidase CpaA